MLHSSGRWFFGSQPPKSSRKEKIRSFARARSSSRRAPPNAASKPCSSIASSSVVVCRRLRDARGPVSSRTRPASIDACTDATTSRSPSSATRRSRNSMTSGKLWPVSTCMSGNGKRPGRNAFSARRSSTIESLPPLNSSTGFESSAATSRMMWIASDSSSCRCVSRAVMPAPPSVRLGVTRRAALAGQQPGEQADGDRHADERDRRDVDAGLRQHAERRAEQDAAERRAQDAGGDVPDEAASRRARRAASRRGSSPSGRSRRCR